MTLSPGPTIECDGKTWRLSFNTQDAKGRLEDLIRAHVVRDALKSKRALGGAEGDEAYRTATQPLEDGEYDTFGERWKALLSKPAGSLLFLLSLLQKNHPDATIEDARKLYIREQEQTESALFAISPDFFAAMSEQMGATPEEAVRVAADVASSLARLARAGKQDTDTPSSV